MTMPDMPENARAIPPEAARLRSVPQYDAKQDLYLSFRHANDNGERSVIRLRMPDMTIANVLFDYFVKLHMAVRLVQPTGHDDVERILRESEAR